MMLMVGKNVGTENPHSLHEFFGMSANPKSAFFIVAHARGKIMMNGQLLLASSS